MKTGSGSLHGLSALAMAAIVTIAGLGAARAEDAAGVRVRHAQAIEIALAGDAKTAVRLLRSLQSEKMSTDEKDRVNLSIGRVLYGTGDYIGAIESYMKVTAGSDSWFEALEERAWAHMQLNQPEEALAQLKTLLSPLFKDKASSEPYFLAALAHLRVCDYPALFKDLDLFKTRFRDRVKAWEASAGFDAQAATRVKAVSETIQKLNIVEAEAIQRLYMDEDLKKKRAAPPKIVKGSGQLSFPVTDSDEVWLDEVDNYHVRVSGCPQSFEKTASPQRGRL